MDYNPKNAVSIGKKEGAQGFLSLMNKPMDIEQNTEASTFICNNYDRLIAYVRAFCGKKVADPAEMVHEVWYSIKLSEEMGEGYDPMGGSADGAITVDQFVYGRLKKYCLKAKYKTYGALTRYADEADSNGAGIPNFGGERKIIKNRNAVVELPAYTTEDLNLVYENASDEKAEEAYDRVDDFESIHDCIEELFNYDDERLNMRPFLKNLAQICRKDMSIQNMQRMFTGIIEFTKEQDIFRESLFQVISFAIKYPAEYQVVVASL